MCVRDCDCDCVLTGITIQLGYIPFFSFSGIANSESSHCHSRSLTCMHATIEQRHYQSLMANPGKAQIIDKILDVQNGASN